MIIDNEYLKMCETLILKTELSLGDYVCVKNSETKDTGIVVQVGQGTLVEIKTLEFGVKMAVPKADVFIVYRIDQTLGLAMDRLNTIHPLDVWNKLDETVGEDLYYSRFNTLEKLVIAIVAKRFFNRTWINGAWQ